MASASNSTPIDDQEANIDDGAINDSSKLQTKFDGRRAKWWYATFHDVTAMVGAGVLSLPYAMAHLGWGFGTLVLLFSWCATLFTLWLMIELHECVPGRRFDRYVDLGKYALGPRLGVWVVVPQQLIVQVGCDVVYMVTGGKCLEKFAEIVCSGGGDGGGVSSSCPRLRTTYWICIFGSVHFFLSQLPDLSSVAGVSFAAAVMSLSYSTIAWSGSLTRLIAGSREPTPPPSPAPARFPTDTSIFRVFSSLGQVAFAYAGHGVALEIQATIPSTSSKPSKLLMWKGTVAAYVVTAVCYFPVAIFGFWAFGRHVGDNVLVDLQRPPWLIAAANLMVVVHVAGSYQVYAMPVFDGIETIMTTRFGLPPGVVLRGFARSTYVAFTLFMAVTFPFFADLLGFFGGFGFTPTSYFLPCIIWLAIKKPRRFSFWWNINWGCIIVGSFIMVAATVGGLRNILLDSSNYYFYS